MGDKVTEIGAMFNKAPFIEELKKMKDTLDGEIDDLYRSSFLVENPEKVLEEMETAKKLRSKIQYLIWEYVQEH